VDSGEIQIAPGVFVPGTGVRVQFSRSGGPGGQNVNKVNSKAELWISLAAITGMTHRALARLRILAGSRLTQQDELHLRSETERSQEANRDEVFDRLREMIIQARVEPKPRRKTKPSRASKQRRLDGKRHRGEIKSHRRSGGDDD
jgi:ribosome-associated protein